MADMAAALDQFGSASLWSLNAAELADAVVTMERVSRRLAAAQLTLLAQADSANVAAQTGASSTAVWLRSVADVPVGVGKARLALHRELVNRDATARALSAGDINLEHASAVVAAINALPAETPAALTDEIEALLVDTAREEGTRAVLNRSAQIFHKYAPNVLEERERRQREDRFLTLFSARAARSASAARSTKKPAPCCSLFSVRSRRPRRPPMAPPICEPVVSDTPMR